jgi:hypothetical protein
MNRSASSTPGCYYGNGRRSCSNEFYKQLQRSISIPVRQHRTRRWAAGSARRSRELEGPPGPQVPHRRIRRHRRSRPSSASCRSRSPGGDIYPALEKGTIDAAEWVGPYDDQKLGFNKVAKNYYFPGWWEPGPCVHFFVNKDQWAKLPKDYQAAWEAAAYEANVTMMAEYDAKNPAALRRLVGQGVKLKKYSADILDAAYKAAVQLYSDESAKNPAFNKMYADYLKFQKEQNQWFSVAELGMDQFLQSRIK